MKTRSDYRIIEVIEGKHTHYEVQYKFKFLWFIPIWFDLKYNYDDPNIGGWEVICYKSKKDAKSTIRKAINGTNKKMRTVVG